MSSFLKKLPGVEKLSSSIKELIALEKENQKRLDELNWANVFNSSINGSKWLKHQSFHPGRWAAGYPMLYILYRIYNDIRPASVLEFGLGESTKLAYQYIGSQPNTTLTIIEQDENWLNFFSNEVYNVRPNTVLLPIEKQAVNGHQVNQYIGLIPALSGKTFSLIVVDGPWGSEHFSRYQVVELVRENKINPDDFIILLDDYNRDGERETAKHLRDALNQKGISFSEGVYAGAKETLIICAAKYSFLTTL
jgi:hypothetical protein